MRADVQDRFRDVAREMLAIEDTYVARVSRVLVDEMAGEWSPPVRCKIEPSDDGTVEIIFEAV